MNLNTEIYMYRDLSFKRIMSLENKKKKSLTSDWLDLVKEVGRFLIMLSVLHTQNLHYTMNIIHVPTDEQI